MDINTDLSHSRTTDLVIAPGSNTEGTHGLRGAVQATYDYNRRKQQEADIYTVSGYSIDHGGPHHLHVYTAPVYCRTTDPHIALRGITDHGGRLRRFYPESELFLNPVSSGMFEC